MHRRIACVALVAALLGPTSGAAQTAAQPTPSTTATAAATTAPTAAPTSSAPATTSAAEDAASTFQLGREAFKAGDFARALEHFQKSYTLEATPGTLLNIALTEEKLGKTATALRSFERVVGLLKADDDRLPIAREGIERVRLRAPRLKIERAAGAPPTLAIKVDGESLAASLVGTALPMDPGKHVVTTTVFGFEERTYEVTLVEGQQLPLAVEPGKRTLVAAPVTTATATDAGAPVAGRVGALALTGAGLAGLGMGIVTGVLALSKKDELAVACPDPNVCSGPGQRALGEARSLADMSTGTLIFGGIATAAGVALLFTVGGGKSLFVSASAAPGAAGLTATGRF